MEVLSDMTIRQAELADGKAIRSCAVSSYQRYVPMMGRKPAPMTADFDLLIAAEQVWIAVGHADHLLGYIVFYAQDDQMMLDNVAVHPDAAGNGIGKMLIGFCETQARLLGCRTVSLYTNEKMNENLLIYPHLGYAEVGRRVESGFARVYFEKSLA